MYSVANSPDYIPPCRSNLAMQSNYCAWQKSQTTSHQAQSEFWALPSLCFEIKQGLRIGIIWHNGTRKSTLLKILNRSNQRAHCDRRVSSKLIESRNRLSSKIYRKREYLFQELGFGWLKTLTCNA